MRLTHLQLAEGQRCPWWARPWRANVVAACVDLLPIPLCWIARGCWTVYTWSFRFRSNALERREQRTYRAAHDQGFIAGQQYLRSQVFRALEERDRRRRLDESPG